MWGAADRGFLYLKHIEFIDLSCIRRDTHVAPLGLWVKQDLRPTRVCMQFRWGIWGRHALPYTLRSSGGQGLEGSSFYRYTAPLERKTHVVSPGLMRKKKRSADLRSLRINCAGKMPDLRVCVQVTAYGAPIRSGFKAICLLLANRRGLR